MTNKSRFLSGPLGGDLQIGAMHSEYFAGIAKYDHIGLAKPIDENSAIGFTFVRFGIDNIPNTIDLIDPSGNIDYDRITSFSSADHAFIVSEALDDGMQVFDLRQLRGVM